MSKSDDHQTALQTGLLHTDQRTSPAIRDKLGEQLRAMFGKPEEEPLPDQLVHLVRQLDQLRTGRKP
jgi:hypothetical protein